MKTHTYHHHYVRLYDIFVNVCALQPRVDDLLQCQKCRRYPNLVLGVAMLDPPSPLPDGCPGSLCRFHPFQAASFVNHVHAMEAMETGYSAMIAIGSATGEGEGASVATGDYRNIDGLAREVVRTLRPSSRNAFFDDGLGGGDLSLGIDTRWCMELSQEDWESYLEHLRCNVLVLRGEKSHWCSVAGLRALVRVITHACDNAELETGTVKGASHWLAADAPNEVAFLLYKFIDTCFYTYSGVQRKEDRRAETLGIRPLDQFQSIEEAKKMLGPRKIPTQAAIRLALRKLKAEERGVGVDEVSDDEDDEYDKRATKLAKDDLEYFGYVT